jgi:hypothetical protein
MSPQPQSTHARREPRTTEIDGRKDGPNIRLAKAMGSKRGYDPLPPSQYEWQAAKGEPPLYRMWSWFCSHTIAFGRMSPYAVRADRTPATLKDCARDLQLDLGQVSHLFKYGTAKGLWCRKNGRELHLNGDVTAARVMEANNQRMNECTLNLSSADLLIIQGWPESMRNVFLQVWEDAQKHHREDLARTIAEKRQYHTQIDTTIRAAFPLPKKRGVRCEQLQLCDLPIVIGRMLECVHSTSVQATPIECTHGEERGENVSVPAPASLCVSENIQKEFMTSTSSVLDLEADYLVAALQIDAAAAVKLLTESRKIEPSLTWREVLALSRKKLHDVKPRHSVAGLLLATVPGMAKGSMLASARGAVLKELAKTLLRGNVPIPPLTLDEMQQAVRSMYPEQTNQDHTEMIREMMEWQAGHQHG